MPTCGGKNPGEKSEKVLFLVLKEQIKIQQGIENRIECCFMLKSIFQHRCSLKEQNLHLLLSIFLCWNCIIIIVSVSAWLYCIVSLIIIEITNSWTLDSAPIVFTTDRQRIPARAFRGMLHSNLSNQYSKLFQWLVTDQRLNILLTIINSYFVNKNPLPLWLVEITKTMKIMTIWSWSSSAKSTDCCPWPQIVIGRVKSGCLGNRQ